MSSCGLDISSGWNRDAQPTESLRWYAVHTRSRHEKKAAQELQKNGIEVFLPTLRQVHRWSDRRKVIEVPLFSCYVFVNVRPSPHVHCAVHEAFGVLRFISFNRESVPIPTHEIEAVRTLLAHNSPMFSHTFVKIGQRVRIRGGSLDGVGGILVGRRGESKLIKLIVSVNLIQQSVAISLEGYTIEPA